MATVGIRKYSSGSEERAGFKTALKSVLRHFFAHPLHSEKKMIRRYRISNAAIFSVTLEKKTTKDYSRDNYVGNSYCKVCINMNNLNLLFLNDGM